MDGNIVKAAWILGGSILASVAVAGVGLFAMATHFGNRMWEQMDVLSKRSADAVLNAPKNTAVAFNPGDGTPLKIGFEPKLPISMRVENSMDEKRQTRAVFEVEVKPTLNK